MNDGSIAFGSLHTLTPYQGRITTLNAAIMLWVNLSCCDYGPTISTMQETQTEERERARERGRA